jgi:RluA family pseudouridine synthase
VKILYDYQNLMAIHKPEGVLSHPNPIPKNRVREFPRRPKCLFEGPYDFDDRRFDTPQGPIWLIHRLDQDSSGVLLAARDAQVAKECRRLFEEEQVRKIYKTLLIGKIKPLNGKWEDHLEIQRQQGRVRARIVHSQAPNAKLRYSVEKYYARFGLCGFRVELLTGKTHQIRVQSASRGTPIAGDDVYGDFEANKTMRKRIGLRRIFLHAYEIELQHPVTHKKINITDPLPEDLRMILAALD